MRLSLIIFPLILLPVLPVAADWERPQPETGLPPAIVPAPDAVCREQARRIDEHTRQVASAAKAADGATVLRIPEDTWADRLWFARRCFRPRACPAADASGPPFGDGTATGSYERLLRLCGRLDGQK